MFVGTFEHSLDDKGRIVLPSVWRAHFADGGFLSQYDQCVGLWTPQGFEEVAARLTEKVRSGEASQNALRSFSAHAQQAKPDKQGRIVVSERLRTFGALDGDVALIGALDRVEMWATPRWNSISDDAEQSLTRAVTDLGI